MRTLLTFALLGLAVLSTHAESRDGKKSLEGSFYVSVDDAATIYVNGTEVYAARFGESKSPALRLTEGDRLVLKLRDDGGSRRFIMLFVDADKKQLVNFTASDFRIIPGLDETDFTPGQFQAWNKRPKNERLSEKPLPIKSYSRAFWGDMSTSTLACIITPQMFSKIPQ